MEKNPFYHIFIMKDPFYFDNSFDFYLIWIYKQIQLGSYKFLRISFWIIIVNIIIQ